MFNNMFRRRRKNCSSFFKRIGIKDNFFFFSQIKAVHNTRSNKTHLLFHSNFWMSRFVMMRRRPDHRVWMMAQVALPERSILFDLCTWQDQRCCAIRLKININNISINFDSMNTISYSFRLQIIISLIKYF